MTSAIEHHTSVRTTPELMAASYEYAETPFAALMRFDDTVAVITGGAAGIGRGIASRLAELGAAVVLLDVDPRVAETADALAEQHTATVEGRVVDVRRSSELDAVAEQAAARASRRLVWVNAAGIYPSHLLADLGDDEWEAVIGLDLTGSFYGSRAAALAARRMGREAVVINISSVAGFRTGRPPGLTHYASAKHGVQGMTKALAAELGPDGVRVNCIAPGAVVTDTLEAKFGVMDLEAGTDYFSTRAQEMPIRRPSLPDDIARAACFLASDAAANITGVVLPVDAGHLAT